MTYQISVITPVFNGARFIEQCLQNVVDQHCPVAEHLIMDGASTDGTTEIVRQWAEQHPHIRIVSEKDKGQSDAMNKGILQAKGEIISFLNVDDYYEQGVLNDVSSLFNQSPSPDFLVGNLNIWNPDGSFRHYNKPDRLELTDLLSNCFEWPYNPSAYFYKKAIHQLAGPYNIDNHLCMDYEFILNAARVVPLRHVDRVWGNFRMVEGSKTQVSHSTNPDEADRMAYELRLQRYNKLTEAQRKSVDETIALNRPGVSSSTSLFSKIVAKVKSHLRL